MKGAKEVKTNKEVDLKGLQQSYKTHAIYLTYCSEEYTTKQKIMLLL